MAKLIALIDNPVLVTKGATNKPDVWRIPMVTIKMMQQAIINGI